MAEKRKSQPRPPSAKEKIKKIGRILARQEKCAKDWRKKKNLGGGGVRQRLVKKITKITNIFACGAWKNVFFYNIKTSKITKKSLAAKGTASPVILISRSSYKSVQLY